MKAGRTKNKFGGKQYVGHTNIITNQRPAPFFLQKIFWPSELGVMKLFGVLEQVSDDKVMLSDLFMIAFMSEVIPLYLEFRRNWSVLLGLSN